MTRKIIYVAVMTFCAAGLVVAQDKPRVTQTVAFAVNRISSLKNSTPTLRLSVGSERQLGRTVQLQKSNVLTSHIRKETFVTITD